MKSYLNDGETYNPSLHHDKEWIHQSVRALVSLWENDFVPLARTQYENWYIVNLMGAVPRYLTDVPSLASSNRKIEVVGLLHFGLRLQLVKMWQTGESITIFKKSNMVYHLTSRFDPVGIQNFLKLLTEDRGRSPNLRKYEISITGQNLELENNLFVL
ncbi:8753_t:CDS:2 [Entrophospora sp. SA101]|nr:12218_t:CDS:2 [Entrophospora sp. SA101]CAJ0878463.1 8753_t:CDS:2 [Entrophospora sp. SA101]